MVQFSHHRAKLATMVALWWLLATVATMVANSPSLATTKNKKY